MYIYIYIYIYTVRVRITAEGHNFHGAIVFIVGWAPLRHPKIYKSVREIDKNLPKPDRTPPSAGLRGRFAPPISGLGKFLSIFLVLLCILGCRRGVQPPMEIMTPMKMMTPYCYSDPYSIRRFTKDKHTKKEQAYIYICI